jgi:Leucine-rich repeat (LRR) protein
MNNIDTMKFPPMKISNDTYGTLFGSKEQQRIFLGNIKSGPFFKEIYPHIANVNLSLVSNYFYWVNKKFEIQEWREFYENKTINEITELLCPRLITQAKEARKKQKYVTELKLLRKIHCKIFSTLKSRKISKYNELNNEENSYGKGSISHKKVLKAAEELRSLIVDDNLQEIWVKIRENLIGNNIPNENASAQDIRTWLNNHENQEAINGITELDLSRVGLTILPPEIGNLTALKRLNLIYNQLTTLPETIGLTALENLNLQNNKLELLPETIGKLTALKELYLQNNQLTTLPETIGELAALVRLLLENNQLTTLPESIGKLTALEWLYLQNNQLITLPETTGKLTTLEWLELQNNQLTTLPESIGKLTTLEWLHLESNQLTTLPESIGNLTALKYLYLENTKLTTLPESIGKLTALKDLDLENNKLTTLPESIGNFTALKVLNLRSNRLASLPESIGKLTTLEWLYLQNNELKTLPETIVKLTNTQIFMDDETKKIYEELKNSIV